MEYGTYYKMLPVVDGLDKLLGEE